MTKRIFLLALAIICLCATPCFAAGSLDVDIGNQTLTTNHNAGDQIDQTALTAIIEPAAAQKEMIIEAKGNTMLTAPAEVAAATPTLEVKYLFTMTAPHQFSGATINTSLNDNCDQANTAGKESQVAVKASESKFLCDDDQISQSAGGAIEGQVLAVTGNHGGLVLKCPVLFASENNLLNGNAHMAIAKLTGSEVTLAEIVLYLSQGVDRPAAGCPTHLNC